jgi:hypothetical protein
MRRWLALGIALPLVAASAVLAHHSYGATYDLARQVTVEGKLVQFVYRNPHSFVTIQTTDDRRWAVEWSGTGQLGGQGITRETLRVGDQIVIVGRPSRVPGEFRLLMVSLKRPIDGFSWGARSGEAVD